MSLCVHRKSISSSAASHSRARGLMISSQYNSIKVAEIIGERLLVSFTPIHEFKYYSFVHFFSIFIILFDSNNEINGLIDFIDRLTWLFYHFVQVFWIWIIIFNDRRKSADWFLLMLGFLSFLVHRSSCFARFPEKYQNP